MSNNFGNPENSRTIKINILKKLFPLIVLLTLVFTQSFTVEQNENIVSRKQAIKLAEQFIKDNGYTSEKPDRSKMKYELFDREINQTLKYRYNSLQQKAFCFSKDDNEWHIGFLSTDINLKKLTGEQKNSDLRGRAVKVSFDGKEISIAHKDPRFSYFTKL